MCPNKVIALAIFCGVCSGAQGEEIRKEPIDRTQVSTIEITKRGEKPRTLNHQEAAIFIESWDKAEAKGLCKYAPEYWFHVRMKDGRTMEYRAGGNMLKSAKTQDYCFAVSEATLFTRLWEASDN